MAQVTIFNKLSVASCVTSVKKNAMFRFMKKQARVNQKIDERQMAIIDQILDEQIKNSEGEN